MENRTAHDAVCANQSLQKKNKKKRVKTVNTIIIFAEEFESMDDELKGMQNINVDNKARNKRTRCYLDDNTCLNGKH